MHKDEIELKSMHIFSDISKIYSKSVFCSMTGLTSRALLPHLWKKYLQLKCYSNFSWLKYVFDGKVDFVPK